MNASQHKLVLESPALGCAPAFAACSIFARLYFSPLKCESETMFGINHWELLIVLVIALVLFGHRLPTMMRSLGKSVTEFKKGVQGVEDDIDGAGSGEKKS